MTALLYSHLGTQADSDSFVSTCDLQDGYCRGHLYSGQSEEERAWRVCTDFYGLSLEVVHVTYTHILFARTQSYGHAQLQERLGSII